MKTLKEACLCKVAFSNISATRVPRDTIDDIYQYRAKYLDYINSKPLPFSAKYINDEYYLLRFYREDNNLYLYWDKYYINYTTNKHICIGVNTMIVLGNINVDNVKYYKFDNYEFCVISFNNKTYITTPDINIFPRRQYKHIECGSFEGQLEYVQDLHYNNSELFNIVNSTIYTDILHEYYTQYYHEDLHLECL